MKNFHNFPQKFQFHLEWIIIPSTSIIPSISFGKRMKTTQSANIRKFDFFSFEKVMLFLFIFVKKC